MTGKAHTAPESSVSIWCRRSHQHSHHTNANAIEHTTIAVVVVVVVDLRVPKDPQKLINLESFRIFLFARRDFSLVFFFGRTNTYFHSLNAWLAIDLFWQCAVGCLQLFQSRNQNRWQSAQSISDPSNLQGKADCRETFSISYVQQGSWRSTQTAQYLITAYYHYIYVLRELRDGDILRLTPTKAWFDIIKLTCLCWRKCDVAAWKFAKFRLDVTWTPLVCARCGCACFSLVLSLFNYTRIACGQSARPVRFVLG